MKGAHRWPLFVAVLLLGLTSTPVSAISPSAVMVYGETVANQSFSDPLTQQTFQPSASCGGTRGVTTIPPPSINSCGAA